MCGIAGIFNYENQKSVNPEVLNRMSELIAHRGPDDHGYYLNENIGLAHRRLSIIDLSSAGHQPMCNEDENIWLVYNGECYNYREFYPFLVSRGHRFKSNTDAEVIIHLYEEYGTEFLSKLNGMFALAIWDQKKKNLILARDRIGIKPLFFYQGANRLLFASELKVFLADPDISLELNYGALGSFFRFMSIPDPECIFKGIQKLKPGYFLTIQNETVQLKPYWDITNFSSNRNISFNQACDDFHHRFEKVVSSYLISDVPVGAFLSGGIDSSAIVAMINQGKSTPLHTFSVTFKDLPEFDESRFSTKVADFYHTNHHEFFLTPDLIGALPKMVWHADEPFAISSALAIYFLSELAGKNVKVVLTGDGGDEIFAGYPWRHGPRLRLPQILKLIMSPFFMGLDSLGLNRLPGSNKYNRYKNGLLRAASSPDIAYDSLFNCFCRDELRHILMPDLFELIQKESDNNIISNYFNKPVNADELARKQYADLKSTLVSEMLTKVDRMTMAFGLEARVPFLDHHLVEWSFSLQDNYKIRDYEGKYIIKKAMENFLPSDIINRPKHGLIVPLKNWMFTELHEMIMDTLSSAMIQKRGFLRSNSVERLIKQHLNGSYDHSEQIFALLVLELWCEHFMDKTYR